MADSNRIIEKYLRSYAHPIVQNVFWKESKHYFSFNSICLVVPAFAESQMVKRFLEDLIPLAKGRSERLLVIVVVNVPLHCSQQQYDDTHSTLQTLCDFTKPTQFCSLDSVLFRKHENFDLLIAEHMKPSHEKESGVGFARKLGGDIAVMLNFYDMIHTPFIASGDMDSKLTSDHFNFTKTAATAVVAEFEHLTSDTPHGRILQWYDDYIREYKNGLEFAGSPFSYIPLGSTLSYSPQAYAAVRGFPARSAGEDFYLLNKLAKLGPIYQRRERTVTIFERTSNRVPFGTGAFLEKNRGKELSELQSYAPGVFMRLKTFHEVIRSGLLNQTAFAALAKSEHSSLLNIPNLKTELIYNRASSRTTYEQRERHFFDEFDGLKTLQWVRSFGSFKGVQQKSLMHV